MPDRLMHEGQLLGNYRLVRLLGKGGFAEVYLAQHVHLNRLAAIKLLYARVDGPDVKRFKREAQIVADLRHPHIVNIIDFGVQDGSTPYLIMEYAPRGTLRHQYPRGSVLPPTVVLEYIEQVAAALDFAHAKRVIHRDVKPENMLLGEQDELLLSDFGIATLISESGAQVTPHVAGTTAYMAPEQLRGKPCPASDQYALGVVVYEWLCGERPFRGSFAEIAAQHLNATPPSLHERNPHISPALEDVVSIALAKKPTQRYPTVGAFVADFKHALQTTGRSQFSQVSVPARSTRQRPRSSLSQLPTRERSGMAQPQPGDAAKRPISRRTILLSLGSVAMLGGIGGGLAWLTAHQHTAGTASGATAAAPVRTTGTTAGSGAASPTSAPTTNVIEMGTTLNEYHGHTKSVLALAWSPRNNMIASGSLDKTVQIWDASTSAVIANYGEHIDQVNTVAWSPDGTLIASGSNDKQVRIWNPLANKTIRFYINHQDAVSSVAWSPHGTYIASGSFDKTVQVWNASTGELIYSFKGHQDVVNTVAWSPDGTYIASGSSDKTVRVWKVSTHELIYTYNQHSDFVSSVLWSIDGKQIASASDDMTVQIWFALTGSNSYAYQEHKGAVFAIALSSDGTRVASASSDKTVQIWNFSSADKIYTYPKHTDNVLAVAWSPNGKKVVSGGVDKIIRIWQAM